MDEYPKLGIIVHVHDSLDCTLNCLNSINLSTAYSRYHIYVIDDTSNPSLGNALRDNIKSLFSGTENCTLLQYNHKHFPAICNDVVNNRLDDDIDVVLFCDSQVHLINDAITYMMRVYTLHSNICGTLGCRLSDPSGDIHSAGKELCVIKGEHGLLPHTIRNRGYQEKGTFMEDGPEEIFANAGEMFMIKRSLFKDIGGFNEYYGEVFQDIELNVECIKRSLYNFYLDYAICVFYETNEDRHGDGDLDIRVHYDYKRIVSYLAENNHHVGKYIEIFEKTDISELTT